MFFLNNTKITLIIFLYFSSINALLADQVSNAAISEFLANNSKSITDEDGDNNDWIELWNASGDNGHLGWILPDG